MPKKKKAPVPPLEKKYHPRRRASNPKSWRPVAFKAAVPTGGVTLREGGLFKHFMDLNTEYLLKSFSVDEMLYAYRVRAGVKDPPLGRDVGTWQPFWCAELPDSLAGRFLMGAGNTLKWIEHPELRRRMNELVAGVQACQEPDGYAYAFPRELFEKGERGNYNRCWFTQGLIDAGAAGNPQALSVLRKSQDWFNRCKHLPRLIYLSLGLQGHTASTQAYFSPVGKPEDLQVAEKHYVQDWWLDGLIRRDLDVIWNYPLDRSHCYEITGFEAYLDHYIATGEKKLLDAMLAAWEILRDNWEHIGGSWALCEASKFPPKSYKLRCTGENCGSVFWIKFNQRLHRLFPTEEKYVAEIEQSLYNVCLANLTPDGVRYHAELDIARGGPNACNTCCEVHGTRVYSALPEYIYTLAADGIFVDLFEPSSIAHEVAGKPVRVTMETGFPFTPEVALRVSASSPVRMKLRIRVPSWATSDMAVAVNGKKEKIGKPGSYAVLSRTWKEGDRVTFTLPIGFRMFAYTGVDQIAGGTRHALMLGPVLMALVEHEEEFKDETDEPFPRVRLIGHPDKLVGRLRPLPGERLHFAIDGCPGHEYMPYWEIDGEYFSVFPVFQPLAIIGKGRFTERASYRIVRADPEDQVHFARNGGDLHQWSPVYDEKAPPEVTTTGLIRACIFRDGRPASETVEKLFHKIRS